MPVIDTKKLIENRIEAIRKYHEEVGVYKAELDLSGGIDSAVMACLLTLALGRKNVILVHSNINTNPQQTDRAVELARCLDIPLLNLNLNDIYLKLIDTIRQEILTKCPESEIIAMCRRMNSDPTILGSIRSCLRAPIGRGCNRILGGGIRHGTGNECEDRYLRFYQKGGDGEVDTNPIEMLSKTEVYQLAFGLIKYCEEHLNCNIGPSMTELILALPSPDLWGVGDTHNDEKELKTMTGVNFNYGRIDAEIGNITNFGTIEIISRLSDRYHKHLDIPIDIEIFPYYTRCTLEQVIDKDCDDLLKFMNKEQMFEFVEAAIKAEKTTRHKQNSNIPTLGSRSELLELGILSDRMIKI